MNFFFNGHTLQETKISQQTGKGKSSTQKCFGGGICDRCLEGIPPKKNKNKSTHQLKSLVHPSSIPSKKKRPQESPCFFILRSQPLLSQKKHPTGSVSMFFLAKATWIGGLCSNPRFFVTEATTTEIGGRFPNSNPRFFKGGYYVAIGVSRLILHPKQHTLKKRNA